MDMNDRALRDIVVGLGGRTEGVPRETGLRHHGRERGHGDPVPGQRHPRPEGAARPHRRRLHARRRAGHRAWTSDAVGAMAALLSQAIKPNLVQTTEGVPAFVHGGPFANIAHGTNSITATRAALSYADIVVTEAGFAFELGAEKFFDINCRYGGFAPACTVLVATIRALKMHGGKPLAEVEPSRTSPRCCAVSTNLEKHLENIRKFEQPCVVAINGFPTDTAEEVAVLQQHCASLGVPAVPSRPFSEGGRGLHRTGGSRARPRRARRAAVHAALRLERSDRAENRDDRARDVRRAGRRLHGARPTRPASSSSGRVSATCRSASRRPSSPCPTIRRCSAGRRTSS